MAGPHEVKSRAGEGLRDPFPKRGRGSPDPGLWVPELTGGRLAGGDLFPTAGRNISRGLAFTLAAVFLSALILAAGSGCGRERPPSEYLRACGEAAERYAEAGGYLRFVQDSENVLSSGQGTLTQGIRVEGEMVFPDRERYEYREEAVSSLRPGEPQTNSFSYITLDGGKTAYVMGERLASQLGLEGWVHYTPPAGQNRFFDYRKLVAKIAAAGEGAEMLGREEIEGRRCLHLAFSLGAQEILDLRLQEDPSFLERYQGLDWESLLGELRMEVWIGEEDDLPVQVVMHAEKSTGNVSFSSRISILFSGYGELPPSPIEKPAVFAEAG